MGVRVTLFILLTFWALLAWHAASQNACESGWFGSSCQYKCRCRNDNCTTQGDCPAGVACERGWFGRACQYADLAFGARTSQPKTTDGNDSSCLTPPDLENVVITLVHSIHFTWLRIRLSNPDFLYNMTVHFKRDYQLHASLSCTNNRTARVDNTTLDIHCDLKETVNHVILSGKGVQHLCSVYISGGRNVALKQNAEQSSVYNESSKRTNNRNISFEATLAVDGNRDVWFFEGNTCTHTLEDLPNPNLNVTFSRLQYITRYVLYNRNSNSHRLQHFNLRSFNDNLVPVLDYRDNSTMGQLVYTVTPDSVATPIRLVDITAHNTDNILTLCELEVYGDSVCDDGQYGRECDHKCNCDGGQPCFVSTGGCPSGCASGYQGENCKIPCSRRQYGPGCLTDCSQFCVKDIDGVRSCSRFNGACDRGCESGYRGSRCNLMCEPGKYGPGCANTCSQHCANQTIEETSCDHVHGACLYGCQAGYKEPLCLVSCDPGKYGPGCGYNCSSICVTRNTTDQSPCHHVTGFCMFGCLGDHDVQICKQDDLNNRQLIGITVGCLLGVIIVAVITAAGIIVFRRRQRTTLETQGDSLAKSRDNMSLSRNDPSKGRRTLPDRGHATPGVSTAGTLKTAQMGSHGKVESEVMFGYECVVQSCDDSVAQVYETIGDHLASPYEDADDSNINSTPTQNCPEQRKTTKSETRCESPTQTKDNMSLSRNDPSQVHRTLPDGGHATPGVSTEGTQRAELMGSQGKVESEVMFGYDCVDQSCDDSVAQVYETIGDHLASPYETVVDDSNKDITPTHNCSEYANTP